MGSLLSRHIPQTCVPLPELTQVCGQSQGLARPLEKPDTKTTDAMASGRSPFRSPACPRPTLAESGVLSRTLE